MQSQRFRPISERQIVNELLLSIEKIEHAKTLDDLKAPILIALRALAAHHQEGAAADEGLLHGI